MRKPGSPWGIFPFAATTSADVNWDWRGAHQKLAKVNAVRAAKGKSLSTAKPPKFSNHVLSAMRALAAGAKRQSEFNPGVVKKMVRDGFVRVTAPNNYLSLTEKGRLYIRSKP